jgi:16S rRNA (guanine527-N7)-methyltransferase
LDSSEFRRRLTARAAVARVAVTAPEIDQIEIYFRLLARWNLTINLTALRLDPASDVTLDRLLVEPLAAARSIQDSPGRWIDLGSGGGSPAIPMRIVRPQLTLTMVEARERKASFLREAVRDLSLTGVAVLNHRIEMLPTQQPNLAGLHALVTVRAVRVDLHLLSVARWLLMPGGRLFLFGAGSLPDAQSGHFEAVERVDLGAEKSNLLILTARTLSSRT